jgi:dipeptidyl aminopeptidase/acylaminoacyl peptidase
MTHKSWNKFGGYAGTLLLACSTFSVSTTASATASDELQSVTVRGRAELPTIESFFQLPSFAQATLSPDGKNVAMLIAGPNKRLALSVMETSGTSPKVIARFSNADITSVTWVNNKRLVYGMGDRQIGGAEARMGPGLVAIDKDGGNARDIIARTSSNTGFRVLGPRYSFFRPTGVADSADIFITQSSGTLTAPAATLMRVNTENGLATGIASPANSGSFLTDRAGELRVAVSVTERLTSVQYLDPKDNKWRTLITFDPIKEDGFSPSFIGPDGSLYVTSHQGQDTTSVYQYDLTNNKVLPTPLVTLTGYDFEGGFLYSKKKNKLLGIRYETDAQATTWFDEDMKKIQDKVDSLLPGTINNISIATEADPEIVLVTAFSDTLPGYYLLFNTVTEKMTRLGVARPEVNQAQMSSKDMIRFKARDGLEIPAYLTLPKNSNGKKLPMILMVHGGPYVRGGNWNWNPQTQLLASRGYAVLEPDFRGSTGYGKKLYQAGWKQWGLKMQDDLDDARKWAIDQGYADPDRVCIAGASYGGYAVLMGLIRNPDLYKCGISWVGVSDINLLYDVAWSDTSSSQWEKYGMPILIGDQEKDAAQLKATSPLEQAARLKSPLILAYGADDRRVPLVHGTKFYNAIKVNNPDVEWIVYPGEGHGWRKLENNIDFWTRIEKFLDKNIGKH